MPKNNTSEREDGDELVDPPEIGKCVDATEDQGRHEGAKDEYELEPAGDDGEFDEEGGVGDLLGGGAPAHVDGEHVGQERLGDVHGDAAEKNEEERYPAETCPQLVQ